MIIWDSKSDSIYCFLRFGIFVRATTSRWSKHYLDGNQEGFWEQDVAVQLYTEKLIANNKIIDSILHVSLWDFD